MKKKLFLAVVLSCCFALPSFAQNSELNEPYHSYGDYYMVPMSHYNNGSPRYPAIVNRNTEKYVFQPMTRIVEPEENEYKSLNKEAGFYTPFYDWLRFLKPETNIDPVFEGLVWMQYGLYNRYFSTETDKWELFISGIFKIENEQLVPLLVVKGKIDERIFPLENEPFIAWEKKYKVKREVLVEKKNKKKKEIQEVDSFVTHLYDSNFKYVKELDGKFPYNVAGNIIVRNDGTRDTLALLGIGGGIIQDEQGRWGIRDEKANMIVPHVMTKEEALKAYLNRNVWSFSRFCKQHAKVKSDFETQAEYEARMNDPQLQLKFIKSEGLDKEFLKGYRLSLGRYDAETETFPVNGYMLVMQGAEPVDADIPWNDFRITIPRAEAKAFQNNWKKIGEEAIKDADLSIRYDAVSIDDITFTTPDGKTYHWKRE